MRSRNILAFALIVACEGCISHPSETTPLADEIQIVPDSAITQAGTLTKFHIKVLQGELPPSVAVHWTLDTETDVIPYDEDSGAVAFRPSRTGTLPISASAFDSTNQLLASARTILTVQPLDLSGFSRFHQADVTFAGSHNFLSCRDTASLPGYNGLGFAWVLENLKIVNGRIDSSLIISNNGLTLDTLTFIQGRDSIADWGHCTCSNGTTCEGYHHVFAWSNLKVYGLRLLAFDTDSAIYGLSGTMCQGHINLTTMNGFYYVDQGCDNCDVCHPYGDTGCTYQGTIWNTAAIRVTFHK